MLAIYYGTDTIKVRDAAFKALASFPEASSRVISADSFESGVVRDAAMSSGLFGDAFTYLIDMPSDRDEFDEEVKEALPLLASSAHRFIVIEGALGAAEKKLYGKHAAELVEYAGTAAERPNVFVLADALARKDKRSLWVTLVELRRVGIREEEMIGILWWQLKTLRLASKTTNSTEAGLKDFQYTKAKRALTKFTPDELMQLSTSLLTLQHEARLGLRDLSLALEAWVLGL